MKHRHKISQSIMLLLPLAVAWASPDRETLPEVADEIVHEQSQSARSSRARATPRPTVAPGVKEPCPLPVELFSKEPLKAPLDTHKLLIDFRNERFNSPPFDKYFKGLSPAQIANSALNQLFNSLDAKSRVGKPVVEAVSNQNAIVDLSKLKIPPDRLEPILQRLRNGNPKGSIRLSDLVSELLKPEIYAEILSVPKTFPELVRELKPANETRTGLIIGEGESGVIVDHVREVDMEKTGNGYLAYSYEMVPEEAEKKFNASWAGMESYWNLPNGLFAFALYDGAGSTKRIHRAPSFAQNSEEPSLGSQVINGQSCMICHSHGTRGGAFDSSQDLYETQIASKPPVYHHFKGTEAYQKQASAMDQLYREGLKNSGALILVREDNGKCVPRTPMLLPVIARMSFPKTNLEVPPSSRPNRSIPGLAPIPH